MSDLIFRRACPIPIGGVLITTASAEMPSTLYPGTTWGKACQGRCMVGSGTVLANTSDNNGATAAGAYSMSVGYRSGESTHLLTAAESGTTAHNHGFFGGSYTWIWGTGANGYSGTLVQAINSPAQAVSEVTNNNICTRQGSWSSTVAATAANASSAHNNWPPYEVFNIWYRLT